MDSYETNRACGCSRCGAQGLMWPVVLVTLGVLFLLDEFNVVAFERFWPVLLIAIGVVIILRHNASTDGHVPLPSDTWTAPGSIAAGPNAPEERVPPSPDNRQVPNA